MQNVLRVELMSEEKFGFCLSVELPRGSDIVGVEAGVQDGVKTAFVVAHVHDVDAEPELRHIHLNPVGKPFYADGVKYLGIVKFSGFGDYDGEVEFAVLEVVNGDWGYGSMEYREKHGDGAAMMSILAAALGVTPSGMGNRDEDENNITEHDGDQPKLDPEGLSDEDMRRLFGLE